MFFDQVPIVEEEDACYTCHYFKSGIMCPLLEALAVGVAFLEGQINIKPSCGFYVKYKRPLSIVKPTT